VSFPVGKGKFRPEPMIRRLGRNSREFSEWSSGSIPGGTAVIPVGTWKIPTGTEDQEN